MKTSRLAFAALLLIQPVAQAQDFGTGLILGMAIGDNKQAEQITYGPPNADGWMELDGEKFKNGSAGLSVCAFGQQTARGAFCAINRGSYWWPDTVPGAESTPAQYVAAAKPGAQYVGFAFVDNPRRLFLFYKLP